jgi:hypothetical protein
VVKLTDGTTRYINQSDVKTIEKGDAAPAAARKAATPAKTSPAAALSLAGTKSKAESVDTPVVAVQLWQKFIDGQPSAVDLAFADQVFDLLHQFLFLFAASPLITPTPAHRAKPELDSLIVRTSFCR